MKIAMEEDTDNKAQSRQKTGACDDISSAGAQSLLLSGIESVEETKTPEETDGGGVAAAAATEANNKAQSRQKTGACDDINNSVGSGNAVSLLPSGTESVEEKAPEETDGGGVVAPATNNANTDSTNTSRDVSMPWVKDFPVHLLASFFQNMPPPLKRQVEMTTQKMANIMKVHGWRKWHNIDILIPEHSSGSFIVNDSIKVDIGDVVACVQLLLARISVRRFSIKPATDDYFWQSDRKKADVSTALLTALVTSTHDGVEISELQIKVLLQPSAVGAVIRKFSETLTHLSLLKLDAIAIGAIYNCHYLQALEFTAHPHEGLSGGEQEALKDALSSKKSLKTCTVSGDNPRMRPSELFDSRVHHLNHLIMYSVGPLRMYEEWSEPTADQAILMSNLAILEITAWYPRHDEQTLENVLRRAPKLERLHLTETMYASRRHTHTSVVTHVSSFVRVLAGICYRTRRSLTYSALFLLPKMTENVDQEVAATKDDQGMLTAMMQYDKEFVTSPILLSHYGVTAFDARLHAFDPNLTPPTTEHPTQITSIDGSRVYKRLFKIDVRAGVHLSVGFDESPEKMLHVEPDDESEEEDDEEDDEEDETDWHHRLLTTLPLTATAFLLITGFVYWIHRRHDK